MKTRRMFIGPIYEELELPVLKNKSDNSGNKIIKKRIARETILVQDRLQKKYLELQKSKNLLYRIALELPFLQNKHFISENTEPQYICKNELREYQTENKTIPLAKARKHYKQIEKNSH